MILNIKQFSGVSFRGHGIFFVFHSIPGDDQHILGYPV